MMTVEIERQAAREVEVPYPGIVVVRLCGAADAMSEVTQILSAGQQGHTRAAADSNVWIWKAAMWQFNHPP
jgi:hypothetical protein